MDYKKSTGFASGDARGEAVKKPEFGGRRRFLATVAAAGAAVALLGVGAPAAQEKIPEPAQSARSPESGKKTISAREVERLLENGRKENSILDVNEYSGNTTQTLHYKYSVGKTEKGIEVAFRANAGNFEESALFKGTREGEVSVANFTLEGNSAFSEAVVAAGSGKIAVFLLRSEGESLAVQLSSAPNTRVPNFFDGGNESEGWSMPNPGADGEAQGAGKKSKWGKPNQGWTMPNPGKDSSETKQAETPKMQIGYENKGGEITIISAPENSQQGTSILMVTISKEGIVSSEVREFRQRVSTYTSPA